MWCLRLHRKFLILLILCTGLGLFINPCLAGERYISGGPELFVSLDSSDELVPGNTMELPLVVGNKGKDTMELYNYYTIQPEYLPTTAKFASVMLLPGNSPVKVRSNPQIIGDVPSGAVVPAEFVVEIPQDAKAGLYTMQARIKYQYVPEAEQVGTYDIEYYFKDAEVALPVPVVVRKMVILSVLDAESNHLPAGGDGYITFTIRNTGQDTGNQTSVYITPEGASPVVPYSNGVYIGELPPGGVAQPKFKVAVSGNADPSQSYPVSMYAVYRDFEGNMVTSPPVSTGVTFGEKVTIERVSAPSVINPGKTGIVSVTYKNTGNSTIYNAQASISVIDPFSSDDDTAYLGDLKPGDSATGLFSVKSDAGATIKTYSADSEVQYTDAGNTVYISDNIPVLIDVQPDSGTVTIAIVVVLALIVIGAYLWHRKKRTADMK